MRAMPMKREKILNYSPEGLVIVEVTFHEPPFFYRGPVPLVYKNGMIELGSQRAVRWSELKDFRIAYSVKGKKEILGVGFTIPAAAVASAYDGRVLAMAEVDELVKGSGIYVREEHLGANGEIVYSARSFFGFDDEKKSETETKGHKEKEYFFLWPT